MFNFIKFTPLYFLLSGLIILPGLISLALFGLKPGIDFTGGSLLELHFADNQTITQQNVQETLGDAYTFSSIQFTPDRSLIIRSQELSPEEHQQILSALSDHYGQVEEVRFEAVGPTLGQQLLQKTYVAIFLAATAILFYVAWQFKELKYGVCAVLAMLHDTLVVLGIFSLLGHFYGVEIDTLFVTAVLTILSFSVHDTIVVYDRIRESLRHHRGASYIQIVNKAIVETLSRSINNSMTIIFMLTALYLLGGSTTKWFVFALLIGTITGTYSSTFTAAPLLVAWERLTASKRFRFRR